MNNLDLILVAIVAICVVVGYVQGFLRQAANLGAIYLSLVLAAQYHVIVGNWLHTFFQTDATARAAAGFVVVFLWGVLFLGWVIRHVYPTMRLIGLGIFDNAGGAGLGLLTGLGVACLVSIVLGFVLAAPWPGAEAMRSGLAVSTRSSSVLPVLAAYAPLLQHSLTPWFPGGVPAIFSYFT
jgi:uncharacterized membrane protein required for colicin V production